MTEFVFGPGTFYMAEQKEFELDAEAGHLRVTVGDRSVFLQMDSDDIGRPDFINLRREEWQRVKAFVEEALQVLAPQRT